MEQLRERFISWSTTPGEDDEEAGDGKTCLAIAIGSSGLYGIRPTSVGIC